MRDLNNISIHLKDYKIEFDKITLEDINDLRRALDSLEKLMKREGDD